MIYPGYLKLIEASFWMIAFVRLISVLLGRLQFSELSLTILLAYLFILDQKEENTHD